MILHASVTADRPQETAETLATLLGGRAFPVGPGEGTWSAVGPEPIGNLISVIARGTEFHRLPGEHLELRRGAAVRHSAFHLLVETPLTEAEVFELADARGCHAQRARHGAFDVIEFWFDDCLLIEVVTPELAGIYRDQLHSAALRERLEIANVD